MESLFPWMSAFNALLISTSGIFIIRGIRAIRRGDRAHHQQNMLTATSLSALFLVLYLTRMALGGFIPFAGPTLMKYIYYVVLFPHLALACVQAPLVLVVLYFAFRGDFARHRRLARVTYPIWLYVSFTGVLVWALLHFPYHLVGA